ncbi:Olfactory receptor 1537, partial [Dissostichus eleginoides]
IYVAIIEYTSCDPVDVSLLSYDGLLVADSCLTPALVVQTNGPERHTDDSRGTACTEVYLDQLLVHVASSASSLVPSGSDEAGVRGGALRSITHAQFCRCTYSVAHSRQTRLALFLLGWNTVTAVATGQTSGRGPYLQRQQISAFPPPSSLNTTKLSQKHNTMEEFLCLCVIEKRDSYMI